VPNVVIGSNSTADLPLTNTIYSFVMKRSSTSSILVQRLKNSQIPFHDQHLPEGNLLFLEAKESGC
jgi:hypothetical protein